MVHIGFMAVSSVTFVSQLWVFSTKSWILKNSTDLLPQSWKFPIIIFHPFNIFILIFLTFFSAFRCHWNHLAMTFCVQNMRREECGWRIKKYVERSRKESKQMMMKMRRRRRNVTKCSTLWHSHWHCSCFSALLVPFVKFLRDFFA